MKGLELGVAVEPGLGKEFKWPGLVISIVLAQARQCNEPSKLSPPMRYQSRLFYVDFYPEVLCPDHRVSTGEA